VTRPWPSTLSDRGGHAAYGVVQRVGQQHGVVEPGDGEDPPYRGRGAGDKVHVVLDNLSTHTTPEVTAWLERNPHVHFHFTPVGSSWLNQIETWFGIITRQSLRRGTFTSVTVLVKQIRDYIEHWNADSKPFVWTATADDILAKVQLVQTSIRKLVDNNAK